MSHIMRTAITLFVLVFASASLQAGPITFDLEYSGTSFGNSAVGTGSITFDDANLPNPGVGILLSGTLTVLDFSITISGTAAGNGAFGLSDYVNFIWVTNPAVDLGAELISQGGLTNFSILNNVGTHPDVPRSVAGLAIGANSGNGESLLLISMAPAAAVPTPSTLLLLSLLLPMLARMRRIC